MTFKQGPLAGYWNCLTVGCSSKASKQTGRKLNPPVPGITCLRNEKLQDVVFIGRYRKFILPEKCVSKSQDSCQNVVTRYKNCHCHALNNPWLKCDSSVKYNWYTIALSATLSLFFQDRGRGSQVIPLSSVAQRCVCYEIWYRCALQCGGLGSLCKDQVVSFQLQGSGV